MLTYELFRSGSTGSAGTRQYVRNMGDAGKVAMELTVEAVGATPSISVNVQGLVPGGDPAVAAHWVNLATVTPDASVATSNAAITASAVGKTFRYVDGLASRFFDALGVIINSNTNVTFQVELHRQD